MTTKEVLLGLHQKFSSSISLSVPVMLDIPPSWGLLHVPCPIRVKFLALMVDLSAMDGVMGGHVNVFNPTFTSRWGGEVHLAPIQTSSTSGGAGPDHSSGRAERQQL